MFAVAACAYAVMFMFGIFAGVYCLWELPEVQAVVGPLAGPVLTLVALAIAGMTIARIRMGKVREAWSALHDELTLAHPF